LPCPQGPKSAVRSVFLFISPPQFCRGVLSIRFVFVNKIVAIMGRILANREESLEFFSGLISRAYFEPNNPSDVLFFLKTVNLKYFECRNVQWGGLAGVFLFRIQGSADIPMNPSPPVFSLTVFGNTRGPPGATMAVSRFRPDLWPSEFSPKNQSMPVNAMPPPESPSRGRNAGFPNDERSRPGC